MATPSPGAAAQAWLDRLPQAQRLAAGAHTDAQLVGWAGGLVLVLVVSSIVARSGVLGRLRRTIEQKGPRPWLAGALSAGAFALMLLAAKAPFDALVAWRGDQILAAGGASPGPGLAARLGEAASGAFSILALAIVFVPLLQQLVRSAPRAWPLAPGAVFAALCLALGWAPHAFPVRAVPAPPSPASAAVHGLLARAGLPGAVVAAAANLGVEADVAGDAHRTQVLAGPGVLAAPPAQARAIAAHVLGHFVHGDFLTIYLVYAGLGLGVLIAVQRLAAPVARLAGPAAPPDLADPESLPIAAMIAAVAIAAAGLGASAYIRWVNVRADAYALDLARDPDAMAAALERQWDHKAVDPSPLETAIFYTHPPLRSRLEHAMTWKATHSLPFMGRES